MNETWKSAVGFEGFYEVSNLGRVRSVLRFITKSNGATMRIKERILKPRPQKSGHLLLWLRKDKKTYAVNVHRLVANAFLGPCPTGMECCHNNGIAWDNRAENLRWDTRSSNIKQAYVDGRVPSIPNLRGLQHSCSKLDKDAVQQIRDSVLSCAATARKFGVSPMTVSRCRRSLTYQDVV